MDHASHNKIVSFIWSIADNCLLDVFVADAAPKEEQIPICKLIKKTESLRNQAVKSEETQIQSLKTLRSTLIAHAVTGKIKV